MLHLDPALVKQMVKILQDTLQMQQPSTRALSFEEWYKQYSQLYLQKIKNKIFANKVMTELLQGETTTQPTDTAEIRRQKSRKHAARNRNPA